MSTTTDAVDANSVVMVSGRGTTVNFEIDDSVPIEIACRHLREHLGRSRNLYSDGEVTVDIGRRILSGDQRERFRKVIESESGLSVKQFWCQPAVLDELRQRIDQLYLEHEPIVRQYPPAANESNQPAHEPQDAVAANGVPEHSITDGELLSPLTEPEAASDGQVHVGGLSPGGERYGIPALVVRGTCRAGEVLRVPGNVVVLGNVNPGAQIIAEGDILVFGSLRGMAHAGAAGDSTATIIAMSTGNPDLRIAEYVYSTDDLTGDSRGAQNNDRRAVIARVQNRSLRVSAYLKNHSIDHGGNPNER